MNSTETNSAVGGDQKQCGRGFYYITLVLLIILGSIERVYGIDRQSLWSDELFAVMASYLPFSEAWHLMVNDSHPPGYVTLMYWTLPWLGYSDFSIRLHALIYGILWIPMLYWIGKRWFSRETGLIASAIIASSYTAIYFSQEARAYSMLVTFCLGNLICFLEILFSTKCHRGYIKGFIISSALILYLHYTCFVFFAAEILLYLILHLTHRRKNAIREMLMLFGIPLLVYSPWLGLMLNHLTDETRNWAVSGVPSLTDAYYVFERLWGPHHGLTLVFIYCLVASVILSVYDNLKKGYSRQSLVVYTLGFMLVVPVLAFYIESQIWTPIFEKRYFMITLPIVALLTAVIASRMLQALVSPEWRKLSLITSIVIFSVWAISTNIDKKIYTDLDKDPIREAVNIIKQDLGNRSSSDDYMTIMTHSWFEHYLKQAGVSYDPAWKFRIYYVSQQIGYIDEYLKGHPNQKYIYYLSWTNPADTLPAVFALKQQYKLLSEAQVAVPSGKINIFKFSAKETPDNSQLENAGTNQTNEAAKLVAEEVKNKKPGTYTTLMTHDWMQAYLRRNNVHVDEGWAGKMFYLDIHSASLFDYLQTHPDIDTLYYFALRDPKTENAITALELQYQLVSRRTVEIAVGKLDIFKFNTKIKPSITAELKQRAEQNPAGKAAALIGKSVHNIDAKNYTVITSRYWFQAYMPIHNVHLDEFWTNRYYIAEFQSEEVFNYLHQHPASTRLYYLALRNNDTEIASMLLQTRYRLVSKHELDSDYGKIDIYEFDTKTKPGNIDAIKAKLTGSQLYRTAKWVRNDANKLSQKKYTLLLTHDFFNPYLQLNDVAVDTSWRDRFFSQANQTDGVINYLKVHPDISSVYYLALYDANIQAAVDALKKHAQLTCQKIVESPPLGRIAIMKFNIRETPDTSNAVVPACSE